MDYFWIAPWLIMPQIKSFGGLSFQIRTECSAVLCAAGREDQQGCFSACQASHTHTHRHTHTHMHADSDVLSQSQGEDCRICHTEGLLHSSEGLLCKTRAWEQHTHDRNIFPWCLCVSASVCGFVLLPQPTFYQHTSWLEHSFHRVSRFSCYEYYFSFILKQ